MLFALAAVLGFATFLVFDAALRDKMEVKPPRFETVDRGKAITLVIMDGVQAEPWLRFAPVRDLFHNFNELYPRPDGDRFDFDTTVEAIYQRIEHLDKVIFLAASMGAKEALAVLEKIEERGGPQVVKFIAIDPLWSGWGVKNLLAKVVKTWYPGPIQNRIWGWVPGALVGKDAPNDSKEAKAHHGYGREIAMSRYIDEIRAATRRALKWRPKNPPPFAMLRSTKDETLNNRGDRHWLAAFGVGKDAITWIPGTHHVGIGEQPNAWRGPIAEALPESS